MQSVRPVLLIGSIFMTATATWAAKALDGGPSGALAAFTSSDPLVKHALALMSEGKFAEAQALLTSDNPSADAATAQARDQTKEIVRRTRLEYSQTPVELLTTIQKKIPDATASDLERWRQAGEAQARVIDGEVKYFKREPANLFRFCAEAKQRRDAHARAQVQDPNAWTLIKHLSRVIEAAEKSGHSEVVPIRHRIAFKVTVHANPPGAKPGSIVRCWLPFPQEYRQQKDVQFSWSRVVPEGKHAAAVLAPNAVDGNPVAGAAQRTAYLEYRIEDPSRPIVFEEEFEYTSFAYYPILKDEDARPLAASWNGACLGERPPHIVFSPELKQTVEQIVGAETNPLKKVRAIFHWIDANIKYHAEEEYCVIPSFAGACLSRHKGDCGIQSMLFVAMCRAAGVPARWQSGWETKRDSDSMHDWAEFYVEPWGWLPADPSYGVQKASDDPRVRDFYIGHQDSYRMIVSLDYGRELIPAKKSFRSEPADFQRGEVEIDGRNLYFDGWEWDITIHWLTDE
jgi:transglutaminase-like putative cysteine protease